MILGKAILELLKENNIKNIYGLPSGTICHIVDSFNDVEGVKYIVVKNEATATYCASKVGKLLSKPQVVLISGAVGVANAINGISEAFRAKSPMIIISGTPSEEMSKKGAMQSTSALNYLQNITKYNLRVDDPSKVLQTLQYAINLSQANPMGPVHIEVPLNVQKAEVSECNIKASLKTQNENFKITVNNNIEILEEAYRHKKGIILVGGGCRGEGERIKELAKNLNFYIMTTASGKSVIEEEYPYNLGNYGFPGTDIANRIMNDNEYSCLLVLGSQLGENDTNHFHEDIEKKVILRVDSDIHCNESYKAKYTSVTNIRDFLSDALAYGDKNVEEMIRGVQILNMPYEENSHTGLSLRRVYEEVPKHMPKDSIYLNDVGMSWVFSTKYLSIPAEGEFLCDVNYGCMGTSVGYIGVNIETSKHTVVFTGDGAFYMNHFSELLVAMKYNISATIFIVNNAILGYVSKGHESIFGRSLDEFKEPKVDLRKIINAMGIPVITLKSNDEISNLKEFLKDNIGRLSVVELIVDMTEPIPTSRFSSIKKVG